MKQQSTVTINNIKYLIKNKNDIIQGTLLKGNQWNNDIVLLIGYWIKKFNLKHFVNIGSHIGTVALPHFQIHKKSYGHRTFSTNLRTFLGTCKIKRYKKCRFI